MPFSISFILSVGLQKALGTGRKCSRGKMRDRAPAARHTALICLDLCLSLPSANHQRLSGSCPVMGLNLESQQRRHGRQCKLRGGKPASTQELCILHSPCSLNHYQRQGRHPSMSDLQRLLIPGASAKLLAASLPLQSSGCDAKKTTAEGSGSFLIAKHE